MEAGVAWVIRQWRRILTALIAFNFVLIVVATVYQHSAQAIIPSLYYRQLVFQDREDSGMDYRTFSSQYYGARACPRLADRRPAYSITPSWRNATVQGSNGTMKASSEHGANAGVIPSLPGLFIHSVALALAITTRRLTDNSEITEENISRALPFFHSLLPSFCSTASRYYDYHFFLAYDIDDPYLTRKEFLDLFGRFTMDEVKRSCPPQSGYTLHYIRCPYSQKVTWAQNDAAMEAYMAGIEYIYRINDDTEMMTSGWTETFISVLRHLDPPNLGICGPRHDRGNLEVLTYEFTHRSHVEIFGCYYPRILKNWDGDVWITTVYRPERSFQINHISLIHTLDAGTRYQVTSLRGYERRNIIGESKSILNRYISSIRINTAADPKKVIAISINMTDPRHLWGAVRNAQLRGIYFPDWTMRVYVTCDAIDASPASGATPETYKTLPVRVLRTLNALGVDIRVVDPEVRKLVPVSLWSYLAVDDPGISFVLMSNPEIRLHNSEFAEVSNWTRNLTAHNEAQSGLKKEEVIYVLGQSKRNNSSAVLNSWAAKTTRLQSYLGTNMRALLMQYKWSEDNATNGEQQFFSLAIWPKVYGVTKCYVSKTDHDANSLIILGNNTLCPHSAQQLYDEHEESLVDGSLQSTQHQNYSLFSLFKRLVIL